MLWIVAGNHDALVGALGRLVGRGGAAITFLFAVDAGFSRIAISAVKACRIEQRLCAAVVEVDLVKHPHARATGCSRLGAQV
jgi:hypothetical protein